MMLILNLLVLVLSKVMSINKLLKLLVDNQILLTIVQFSSLMVM